MNRYKWLCVLWLVVASTPCLAASKSWTGGSGNWSTATNWSGGTLPLAGDDVSIAPVDGVARAITYDTAAPNLNTIILDLTGAGTNRTTLNVDSGSNLTSNRGIIVGNNGRATLNQSAGTVSYSDGNWDAVVGLNSGGNGIYNLSGGQFGVARSLFVGTNAGSTGQFNQTGGAVVGGGNLIVGNAAGATGSYTLDNSATLHVTSGVVSQNGGSGALNINGNSTAYFSNDLAIGTSGAVNLNGGTLRFDTVSGAKGLSGINYASGTIQLAGDRDPFYDLTIKTLFNTIFGAPYIIPSGKQLSIEGDAILYDQLGQSGHLRVDGGTLSVGDHLAVGYNDAGPPPRIGDADLEILNGGTVACGFGLIGTADDSSGVVTVSGAGSSLVSQGSLSVGFFSGHGELNIHNGAEVYVGAGLSIYPFGVVNLDGGTIRFDGYSRGNDPQEGQFNYIAGTVQLAGDRLIGSDAAILDLFGSAPNLVFGKGLTVEGAATVSVPLNVDGGTFSTGQLVDGQKLSLQRGTFNLTNQVLLVGAGGQMGSTLDINDDMTVNSTLGIINQGLVTGDGTLGGSFTNGVAGELRAEPGRSLLLTGSGALNAGRVNLLGGQLEFTQTLTNGSAGLISGNGTLQTHLGLVNQGVMSLAGTANILGDVTNVVGARIISAGGGATIFFDDVVNNGDIRTSTNGFTVFFGAVSGSGTFTGTGTVNFEGDLTPGSSPASVAFGGDVGFGPQATLGIELGGIVAGSQYDRIQVAGELALDGVLDVTLINGFAPSVGQSFDILNWGTITGSFETLNLPVLGGGLAWNTSQLYTTGVLSVTSGLPGDFDLDGDVDGADFLLWQRNPAVGNLVDWQSNYGAPLVATATAVPEPSGSWLGILGGLLFASRNSFYEKGRNR